MTLSPLETRIILFFAAEIYKRIFKDKTIKEAEEKKFTTIVADAIVDMQEKKP